jgi:hypothetical protein
MDKNMHRRLLEIILHACNEIYLQLGPAHNECVYQKALIIELYNMGATSVEFEKHVPVFFTDSKNNVHTIGDERIDILARFGEGIQMPDVSVVLELKAVARNKLNTYMEQLKKYKKALYNLNITPNMFVLVNFPQGVGDGQVEHLEYVNTEN